jgi:hypothetical protein
MEKWELYYLHAIAVKEDGTFVKYHRIKNTEQKRQKFEMFARSRNFIAINYYHVHNKEFSHQKKIQL